MSHLKYMPGDPRLVDQLVYELKSKGIFDQFRKDCIADVDTKPAYQNLRQRVENSVSTFLSRQTWQPDLNKNQLREKLRKHILDGNYLEQGVERIVDQVVNPKVATVFIPKVEDLVYNYLGITRKKSPPETTDEKTEDLLPTDLEAVSPGSVKSNDNKVVSMDVDSTESEDKMEIDKENSDAKEDSIVFETAENENTGDIQLPSNKQNDDFDKINIPLPSEEIKPETIPSPDTSPSKVELEKIELPKEAIISTDIPLPNDICKEEKDQYFKPLNSEDDDSSSGSSLRRNMSPLTPIRNFNNENSCDAQQAFENSTDNKSEDKKEPSSFRFKIDAKSPENSSDAIKSEKKETQIDLSYQFNNQVNINTFDTPLYEDSSNSNNLHIDYESDANSKVNVEIKAVENDQNSEDSKKEKKLEDKKSSHKSSHRSRDSHKHSSSKDKRSESKQSNSRDSSRHEKSKSAKDENKSKPSDKDKSKDKNEKKDSSRDSSRHRSSHKSSHRDSKSHRSSSSSGRHSSKHSDDKKSTSSSNHKDKSSSDKSKESKSSSHRSDKDRKSSSSSKSDKSSSKSKNDDKDKDKKNKKENDDHYSLSGRGNPNRRSTDRDSNDGSSSSKWSHNASSSKFSNSKKDSKSSSKSETTTSATGDSTSPSDKENIVCQYGNKTMETLQHKPIVRIESHLETPVASPPRLPFVPDVTIKKPKFAANFEEAKRLMKMRKFLDEEQKRMNQEAALLLEFQANVRPSMSQVYSSIPGPELEFACITGLGGHLPEMIVQSNENLSNVLNEDHVEEAHYTNNELLTVLNDEEENNDSGSEVHTSDVSNIRNTVNNVQKQLHCTEKIQEIENHISESIVGNDSINVESVKNTKSDNSVKQNNESVEQDEFAHIIPITNDEMSITKDKIIEQPDFSHIPLINEQANLNVETTNQEQLDTKRADLFEVTIITEELSENEEAENNENNTANTNIDIVKDEEDSKINGEDKLFYFGEHEKYNAELERARYTDFFKQYNTKSLSNKIYLINGDTYEENLLRDLCKDFGNYEIVNYHRNGHLKVPKNKNVIKNVNISMEISLPVDADYENAKDDEQMLSHDVFSPGKSECSFELSNDYDAKLEEMVHKTSRQEIMEIILGNVVDSSPSKMPQIAYFTDSNIDREYENSLKRKMPDVETTVNNNRPVLTPNKIRKLSTEQISSTTPETEEIPNKVQNTRSKYLGKAKRVGLPRPRRSIVPNSPSSDKSVENYEQNPPTTPNGKVKRAQIQRYDTSDLYKPKLHYLSRRNHVT